MPILFDKDPVTGVTQYYDYDASKDEHLITSVQDTTALIDQLKKIRNGEEAWQKGVSRGYIMLVSLQL